MRIAILGGGITGLTAGYYLAKKGYQVTIFEKEKNFGGLASGFKKDNWYWYLDITYHHIFANDDEILNFAKEIGFNKFFFQSPITASLYNQHDFLKNNKNKNLNLINQNYQMLPLDTPLELIKFPYLNFFEKLRVGLVLTFLKLSPFLPVFEKTTSFDFFKKTMGEKAFNVLFEELFRKKFGKYAENILTSFFWARIKKRTKSLGYPVGGFQNFINYLLDQLKKINVQLISNFEIKEILKVQNLNPALHQRQEKFKIQSYEFDVVISTLPSSILVQVGKKIFPANFLQNFRKIKYLNALTVIIESKKPLLNNIYWLNVSTSNIPIMAIVEHTNFIDKKYFGGNHIVYLGWYLEDKNPLMKMDSNEISNFINRYLKLINNSFQASNSMFYVFRSGFAQPIFDKDFIKHKPNFFTPIKNFYIANLDMTYPYDRGTNYAVKLGKEAAKIVIKS